MDEVNMKKYYKEYQGAIVNSSFEKDTIASFKVHDSDVWICGFPRSGTTLTQEITYLVNTLDFDKARTVQQPARILFADCCLPRIPHHGGLSVIAATEPPRMIKSHLHYYMMPDDIKAGRGKVVYVARHPAPTSISLYGMLKYFQLITETSLQEFVKQFLEDKVYGCPWWRHVLEYWEHRNDDNILFLYYKDIVKDKRTVIHKLAKFLDKDLTDTDVEKIIEHTKIDNMRDNKQVNFSFMDDYVKTNKSTSFINTGSLDRWKSVLPEELQQRLLTMMKERLGHTDLNFQH